MIEQRQWYGAVLIMVGIAAVGLSEPVVVRGENFPAFLGKPVSALRLHNRDGTLLPVQIDEVTEEGEYVCDRGESVNTDEGNGTLDARDEIVLMYEDCLPCQEPSLQGQLSTGHTKSPEAVLIRVGTEERCRETVLSVDATGPVCQKKYITYDHSTQHLVTPRYYARFAPDRFHFTRAGIAGEQPGTWVDLTRELGIEIRLRALWGLLPVRYTEENLVCFVKRYKVGPVRLIRRGDLHLRIGLGVKGGRAAVHQICYPSMVSVPVSVHLPVRFRHFFKDAYLEMTPVIAKGGGGFVFSVAGCNGANYPVAMSDTVDTLHPCALNTHPFTILRHDRGVGWVVQSDIPVTPGMRSGFIFRRPSKRGGLADCGYRLLIQDVPRGWYTVSNRVLFTRADHSSITEEFKALDEPAPVRCGKNITVNLLTDNTFFIAGRKR